MKLAQLEADFKAKQTEAKDLVQATLRAAEAEDRAMTAEENAKCQAKLDELKGIKARIDGMQSDANLMAAVSDLTAGVRSTPATAGDGPAARRLGSLGHQFVSDPAYRAFIASHGHRRTGNWTSPSVELYGATLTGDPASGGALVPPDRQPGIVALPTRRTVVADLIAPGTTTSNLVEYVREKSFVNAANAVAEGAAKPESTLTFEPASAPVRKIAHWIPVTEEMLSDYSQTQSIIDARLRLGLALEEEDQLLNGSGIAPHLLGFLALPGLTPALPKGADTTADAMFKQMTIIATNTFIMPDGFVMNPADWAEVQLAKNSQGNYLGSGPWATPQTPTLWGINGAITPVMVNGTTLVGGFMQASQIFRNGGVKVESSNSHQDFFVKNLVAIRAEERLALAVYREAAFGTVTGI